MYPRVVPAKTRIRSRNTAGKIPRHLEAEGLSGSGSEKAYELFRFSRIRGDLRVEKSGETNRQNRLPRADQGSAQKDNVAFQVLTTRASAS